MLTQDFNELDKKYIAVKSKYILDNDKGKYLNSIQSLAKEGQINALQDFFINVNEFKEIPPEVIIHISSITPKFRRNFEENYLLALYADSKGLRSATTHYAVTYNQIHANILGQDRSPVSYLRYAEICEQMKVDRMKDAAIELAREGFRNAVIASDLCGKNKLAFSYSQIIFLKKYCKNNRNVDQKLVNLLKELSSSESE